MCSSDLGNPHPHHPLIQGDWVNIRGMSQREINIKCVKLLDGNLTKKELRQMNDEEINLRLAQAIDKIHRDAPGAPSEGVNRASQRANRSPEIDRDPAPSSPPGGERPPRSGGFGAAAGRQPGRKHVGCVGPQSLGSGFSTVMLPRRGPSVNFQ